MKSNSQFCELIFSLLDRYFGKWVILQNYVLQHALERVERLRVRDATPDYLRELLRHA